MTSRVIRGLLERLHLTQAQLAEQIGVKARAVHRWSLPEGRWCYPKSIQWRRIRELWFLAKYAQSEEFWEDRLEPPDFSL